MCARSCTSQHRLLHSRRPGAAAKTSMCGVPQKATQHCCAREPSCHMLRLTPRHCLIAQPTLAGITVGVSSIVSSMLSTSATTIWASASMCVPLIAVWLCVALVLAFTGGALAARAPLRLLPAEPSKDPAPVPPAARPRAQPYVLAIAAGLLPSTVMMLELAQAMDALWRGAFYPMAGFATTLGATVLTCMAISILCTCAPPDLWMMPAVSLLCFVCFA